MTRRGQYILVLSTLLVVSAAMAGDWPQFRGPAGDGVTEEKSLPTQWSATENLRWKAELPGRGVSGPVVANGRAYVTASSGYKQDRLHVLCFDAQTGQQLWERQFWATGPTISHPKTCMAAPTPTTDGKRVYALFATGDLFCIDRDGNLLWCRALAKDYPAITNNVGMAASPVLWHETLLLPLENAGESFAAGLDIYTGQNRWKIDRAKDINWVTPVMRQAGDRVEAIFQTRKEMTAYDPLTGKVLWTYEAAGLADTPSPVVGGGLVFTGGSEFTALKPDDKKASPELAWKESKFRTGPASPAYYQGRLYIVNSAGVVACADAKEGKILWQVRLKKGPFWASPVVADGKLYAVNEEGDTSVVELGEQGKLLATNPIGEGVLGTPAIADGAIFLRSDKHLFCIGKK